MDDVLTDPLASVLTQSQVDRISSSSSSPTVSHHLQLCRQSSPTQAARMIRNRGWEANMDLLMLLMEYETDLLVDDPYSMIKTSKLVEVDPNMDPQTIYEKFGVPSKQPIYFVWKTKYKGNSRDRKTNNGGSWTQHGGAGKVDDEQGREIGVKRRFIHGRKGATKDIEAEAAVLTSQVYHLVEYTFMADFRKEKRRQEPAAYHCICKLSCKGQKNAPGLPTPASSSDSSPDSSTADY